MNTNATDKSEIAAALTGTVIPHGRSRISAFTHREAKPKAAPIPSGRIGPPPLPHLRFVAALPAIIAPRKRPKLSQRIGGTLGSGFGDVVDARDRDPIVRQPQVRLFGAAPRLAAWARRGVVVSLGSDGSSLVVRERGDVLTHDPRLVQEMRDAAPLTLPYLRGDPAPTCVVGSHDKGEDASAVEVGVLGAVSCLRHAQERQP